MSFKRSVAVFGIMMACGLGAYVIAWNGWYPAAIVNYHIISSAALDQNMNIAYDYFKNALSLSGSDTASLNAPQSAAELRRASLDELVSRTLIVQELQHRMSGGDIQSVVDRKIEQLMSGNADLGAGVEKLYGMTLDMFKEKVLTPEAYTEVLEGRMNLTNEDFTVWLASARKNASVIILYPGLSWDGTKVAAH